MVIFFLYLMIDQHVASLPFQPMLNEEPIQVVRMNGFYEESSLAPHRHEFYMLYWTTDGNGEHRIDFRDYYMQPGRVFFLHKNQVHQMINYPADGWMILFNEKLFHDFLSQHPQLEQNGLFDYFNRLPLIDLDETMIGTFAGLVQLLQLEVIKDSLSPVIRHYLSLLLLYAAEHSAGLHPVKRNSGEEDLMRKLKIMIGENYKMKRDTAFYSERLGVSSRKLNGITSRTMGRLVTDLINDRLLSESEALLGTTTKSIKEISYDLGFADQAHFAYFFKKANGATPSNFREQFLLF